MSYSLVEFLRVHEEGVGGSPLSIRRKLEAVDIAVSDIFYISESELRSGSTDPGITFPRQIAMYLAREVTSASFPQIGRHYSRHHSTVIHAVKNVRKETEHNPIAKKIIKKIEKRIKQEMMNMEKTEPEIPRDTAEVLNAERGSK